MTSVLFLCTHNSARSQMAEGWLRSLGGGRFEAFSAGTEPGSLHPLAVLAMREAGVDISGQRSKDAGGFVSRPFDYVITVCDQARETCPLFPNAKMQVHWTCPTPLPSPAARQTGSLPFVASATAYASGSRSSWASWAKSARVSETRTGLEEWPGWEPGHSYRR